MILIVHESGRTGRKFHAVFIFVFITTPLRFSFELLLDKLKFRDFIRFTRCHLKAYRDHLLLDRQPWSCQPWSSHQTMHKWITKGIHQHKKRLHKSRLSLYHYATLESHVSPRFYSCMHNISNRKKLKKHQQKILGEDTAKKKEKKQKTTWHWDQLNWLRIPTWKRPFHPQPAAENPPYSRHHGTAEMLPPRSHWSTELERILFTTYAGHVQLFWIPTIYDNFLCRSCQKKRHVGRYWESTTPSKVHSGIGLLQSTAAK